MGFEGLGEDDVLRVIADVRRAYSVDPDRIRIVRAGSLVPGGTRSAWSKGVDSRGK